MSEEFETWREEEIICPYCGYKYDDSWEFLGGEWETSGEEECAECGKNFEWDSECDIKYSTRRAE